MPNWTRNVVKMHGIGELPLYSITKAPNVYAFDFNKLIPMQKELEVQKGEFETLAIEAVMRRCNEFHIQGKYIGMSDKLFSSLTRCYDVADLEKSGLQYIKNKILYGETNWYDWRVKNWGTKWNACDFVKVSEDEISFSTAWSMPEPIMNTLADKYPDHEIQHWWADEDCGNNSGYGIYQPGTGWSRKHNENGTASAFNTYVLCWGESECMYQDSNGDWNMKDCNLCNCC